jgi:hypothetical protein
MYSDLQLKLRAFSGVSITPSTPPPGLLPNATGVCSENDLTHGEARDVRFGLHADGDRPADRIDAYEEDLEEMIRLARGPHPSHKFRLSKGNCEG